MSEILRNGSILEMTLQRRIVPFGIVARLGTRLMQRCPELLKVQRIRVFRRCAEVDVKTHHPEIDICSAAKFGAPYMQLGTDIATDVDVHEQEVHIETHTDGDTEIGNVMERVKLYQTVEGSVIPCMNGTEGEASV
jgi:hypothetical protein